MNKKQTIKVNEKQFAQIVKESVDRILNPAYPGYENVYGVDNIDNYQHELSKEDIQQISYYLDNMSKDVNGIADDWAKNHEIRTLDYLFKRLDYLISLIKHSAWM